MYILKNAWRNIVRNKRRNILLGIIIVVIALCSTVSLAINNTSNKLIESYKDAYLVEATISFNRSNMRGEMDFSKQQDFEDMKEKFESIESLTVEEVKEYSESEYVKDFYYTSSIGMNGKTIEKATSDFSFGKGNGRGNKGNGNVPNMAGTSTDFTLTGYSNIESMTEFINGTYTLSESTDTVWEDVMDGKNVIINSELAELNELSVGSTFKLTDSESSKNYTFTVVGIYTESENETEMPQGGMMSMFSNSVNTIVTNTTILETISIGNEIIDITVNPTYVLNDFESAENFETELYGKGLDENYSVSTNEEEVKNSTRSVENLKTFSNTFLIITLVIGVVVLFIINEINIRERKYEIGVLRTIGMKKSSLCLQFTTELLITTIFALALGALGGSLIAKPVSNSLLKSEITSSKESINKINENFGGNMNFGGQRPEGEGEQVKENIERVQGVVNVQAFDEINAVVDFKVLLQLLAIGISLTIVSSMSTMLSIQRFSPLEILKERS